MIAERICKTKNLNFYVIPHHLHPTTVTLSAERRKEVITHHPDYQLTVIEDNYDLIYDTCQNYHVRALTIMVA